VGLVARSNPYANCNRSHARNIARKGKLALPVMGKQERRESVVSLCHKGSRAVKSTEYLSTRSTVQGNKVEESAHGPRGPSVGNRLAGTS